MINCSRIKRTNQNNLSTLHGTNQNNKENKMMNAKSAKTIEPQLLNHYSASALTKNSVELLNHMELELQSILVQEFAQGLPIYCLV